MEDKRRAHKLGYSDIDLANWKDYSDIITDSLWIMQSRENRNGHKLEYHGNFIPQIANQVFRRYTKENDIIIDWFLGSGTSAIEAVNQKRRLIGVELQRNLVKQVKNKVPAELLGSRIHVIPGDSTSQSTRERIAKILSDMEATHAQFAILHPPYDDIIKFSDLDTDLSNCPSTECFIQKFALVARNAYDTLEDGRFAILVIGDKYSGGELVPLGFRCLEKMNEAGFKTKSIVVKNIQGNEKAKGKDNNLWRYRALAGGFYVFKHEYVILFRK